MGEVNPESLNQWIVPVRPATSALDGHARDMLADVRQAGFEHIEGVRSAKVYFLSGTFDEGGARLIGKELLADGVAERFDCYAPSARPDPTEATIVIRTLSGVMNPAALSTLAAIRELLAAISPSPGQIEDVGIARRYEIIGARSSDELEAIAKQVLANECIESITIHGFGRKDQPGELFPTPPRYDFSLRYMPICELDEPSLARLSREAHLFLSVEELQTIQDHYRQLGREPTDIELETFAQSWSEHCVHKTFKSAISYTGDDFGKSGHVEVEFGNLLKDTIIAATRTLDRDWCLSVFVDNAGVIAFDDEIGIAFKAETHNHPSALDPYGGASTGTGGCIRDIMGCGLGAKPIASTDVFCVAPPDFDSTRLPKDVLHPRRVLKGVVSGVRDYGNRMGIPTVNGAIYFDERYVANPLVFCGSIGLIPRNRIDKKTNPGDLIVVAGGRTGRDGIHGATFSSAELTDTHADEFSHAVQIGNAIEEKKVLDAMLIARDHPDGCLYSSVTDCGAGGISCAVSEMGAETGAVVDLEKIPLKYAGLSYDEIWISEAQERMVYSVSPDRLDRLLKVFADEEVQATVIGTFTDDKILRLRYQGHDVGEIDLTFLNDGIPRTTKKATWTAKDAVPAEAAALLIDDKPAECNAQLLTKLGEWNIASKEWVIRQYDHEVQGRSVVKPLVGPNSGPSDAAVLQPIYDNQRGIALGCGLCPHLSDTDPYWMAIAAVDEALRNIVCVGADPDRTAILDNFCWGKCDSERSLGALVRACRGAADVAVAYGLPFISGKDSLNNEFSMSEAEAKRVGMPTSIVIPGTLLISALGIVKDIRRCVTSDLKEVGRALVVASAPANQVGLTDAHALHRRVAGLIEMGRVHAAHDVSDGGLAVALAEMCIASGLGADVVLNESSYEHSMFAEPMTTYVLEMSQEDAQSSGLPIIGSVINEPKLTIRCGDVVLVSLAVDDLARAWSSFEKVGLSGGGV